MRAAALLFILLWTPVVSATHLDVVTPDINQTTPCNAPVTNFAPRVGQDYVVIHGGRNGSIGGTFIRITDVNNVVWQLNRDGTFTNVFAGVSPTIRRMVNVSTFDFYAEVQFTWAAGLAAQGQATCSGFDYYNVWNGAPASLFGFVTSYNTSLASGVAWMFNTSEPTPAVPTCDTCQPFFGEEGSLLGNRSILASSLFGQDTEASRDAVSWLFGLLLVAALTAGGASLFGVPGAFIGASGASLFNILAGWWPVWILVFAVVVGLGAIYLMGRGKA